MDQSTQELIAMIVTAVIGGVIEDTDGNVWRLQFDNPFDQRDLTIGSTIRIRCGFVRARHIGQHECGVRRVGALGEDHHGRRHALLHPVCDRHCDRFQPVVVDWRGLKSGPDVGEYATFDGWVHRPSPATG